MQTNELEGLIRSFSASSVENLKLLLSNSEADKNYDTTKLFNALKLLENMLSILEISFSKISQDEQIVAQLKNTTKKDNLVIESVKINDARTEIEDTVELLREQVETLKQMLYYKELELQEVRQELDNVNESLYTTLKYPQCF
ncbi:MAG: hypothetical protein KME29_27875 [Calothrix sp. FI2-JRJ7]|jgi:septal ring factor EnvC (AmiA/AmiB activator)|nr:hypothetical protein [Calothrix sp. FI2-JRJ7]